MALPALPRISLELREPSPEPSQGFLRMRRLEVVASFPDGTQSAPFAYDAVDRTRLDAVVVVPHHRDASGRRWVWLRSAVRPPLWLRQGRPRPVDEAGEFRGLWEVPAGLVELDEETPAGLRLAAARELLEETGFAVLPEALRPLGPPAFPAPGVLGEKQFFFEVEVQPQLRGRPTEDGSALEREAGLVALPLEEALELARQGKLQDSKTELALRRLAER
jgi:ADP-ribose pyrophosphatase